VGRDGATARQRRRAAQVPDDVHYRPKYDIAPPCRNYRKARANGVTLAWVTADEWYGEKPAFVAGLEQMGQPFVLEIPRNLMGWSHEPADADEPRSRAEDLCRHSPAFTDQKWKRYHVKDTSKGPMVWEARAAPFWTLRDGRVVGPYRLMAARDVLDPDEVKYFLSDRVDVPARVTLRVGLSRWPVERCLEDEKTELGLSHFECRKYPAVLRHLLVTQVSHLFLARQARRLRGKKGGEETTICQVRTAAEALLAAWLLAGAVDRQRRIDRAAAKISRTQTRNAAARASHTKARCRRLRALGIRVERLTSCRPP